MKGVCCKLKKEILLSGNELNSMFPFLDYRSDRAAVFLINEYFMSYPIFMPKPSTHRIYDPGSIVPYIQTKSAHR
jgi:hypothetical protein